MEPRHLGVKLTCGAEAPERANQAWTVAASGVAAGAEVTVWLTGEAVWFAVPGRAPSLDLPHASPVADLVPGAVIAGAASFVEAVLAEGVQALVYEARPSRSASSSALIAPGLVPAAAACRASVASRALIGACWPVRCAISAISPFK